MTLAFVFPGQGSQKVGMLSDFLDTTINSEFASTISSTFAEASDALGFDVWKTCSDADKLAQTAYTQPALLTASVALWRLWLAQGGQSPAVLAGHSLGEYSALVAADVLKLADAVKLVHARGQFMQSAVPENTGAMAAVIGKSDDDVIALCQKISTPDATVAAANFNCDGQVVVAGHTAAVDTLIELGKNATDKADKFRAMKLAVSVPSHCNLMQPAAEKLAETLVSIDFKQPSIPVIQNVDATVHTDTQNIRDALLAQLCQPVQWTATMKQLAGMNVTQGIECGNGNVLSGLAKRQKLAFTVASIDTPEKFNDQLNSLS